MFFVQEIFLKEDHPLAFNLSFSISLGLLPVTLSLNTVGCGIKRSGLLVEEDGDMENSSKEFMFFCTLSFNFFRLCENLQLYYMLLSRLSTNVCQFKE